MPILTLSIFFERTYAHQICFGLYVPLIAISLLKQSIKQTAERKKKLSFKIWTICASLTPFAAIIIGKIKTAYLRIKFKCRNLIFLHSKLLIFKCFFHVTRALILPLLRSFLFSCDICNLIFSLLYSLFLFLNWNLMYLVLCSLFFFRRSHRLANQIWTRSIILREKLENCRLVSNELLRLNECS